MKYSISFLAVIVLFFSNGPISYAQVGAQFNKPLETSVNLELSPQNPGPNQTVTATISSFDTDLNAATISWSINGKIINSGRGLKTFSFSTGSLNTTTNLSLTIKTSAGGVVNKSYSIRPTSVDLIWQTTGYTPPFYKGKALFSYQNKIEFIALPHITASNGVEIPARNLIYTWTRNGTVLGDFSGYGKNTYTMLGSIIARPINMQVEVTSPDTQAVGSAEVTVTPIDPIVLMYEKSPLYGIKFENALLNTFTLFGSQEIEILAEPYFFGTLNTIDSALSYKWSINNTLIDDGANVTSRVFRQKEGTQGVSLISLSIENSAKILQSASSSFNLEFGKISTSQPSF